MEDEKTIEVGDYRIEFADGKLKVMSVHNKKGIAVIPSSGNCVVIVPIERGLSQFKTE